MGIGEDDPRPRRIYKQTGIVEGEGGFTVVLDGRPAKTPAKAPLTVPTVALAEALAAEWAAQGERIDAATMPLTRLVNTAIDRVAHHRQAVLDELARFAEHDLICYRAASPEDLVRRQIAAWQPIVEWLEETFGAAYAVTDGMLSIDQSPACLAALAEALGGFDTYRLTAVQAVAAACRSVAIGLAVAHGRLDAEQAFAVSHVDETFQMEQWGEDAEALARHAALKSDIDAAGRLLALL